AAGEHPGSRTSPYASFATPTSSSSGYGAPTEPLPPYERTPPPPAPRDHSIRGGLPLSAGRIAAGLLTRGGFGVGNPVAAQPALAVALGLVGLGLFVA